MGRMFANDPGDWDSIPDRVMPKTFKMVLDAALLNTQHYIGQIELNGVLMLKWIVWKLYVNEKCTYAKLNNVDQNY